MELSWLYFTARVEAANVCDSMAVVATSCATTAHVYHQAASSVSASSSPAPTKNAQSNDQHRLSLPPCRPQITSLKNLGLNIRRAKLDQRTAANNSNTFYITDAATSEKVLKSARLEEIRMTIINNMMYYHPVRHPASFSCCLFPVFDGVLVLL